mmetsp:Transcript_78217/g.252914  ORF Transcript_78217/g.252914 Transcript_78217/m.252914 type:complete len:296 (-) Transcript_78217:200-1087(-)
MRNACHRRTTQEEQDEMGERYDEIALRRLREGRPQQPRREDRPGEPRQQRALDGAGRVVGGNGEARHLHLLRANGGYEPCCLYIAEGRPSRHQLRHLGIWRAMALWRRGGRFGRIAVRLEAFRHCRFSRHPEIQQHAAVRSGCCETDIARALVEATEQASWKLIAAVAPSILQVDALDLAKRGLPSLDGGPSFYAGVGDTVQGLVNNISLLKETEGSLDACARTPGLGVNVQAWVPIFCRFYTACAQAIDEAVGNLAPGERKIQSGHHPFSHSCDAMFEEIGRGEHASRRAAERT